MKDIIACALFLWIAYLWFDTKDVSYLVICVWISLVAGTGRMQDSVLAKVAERQTRPVDGVVARERPILRDFAGSTPALGTKR